MTLFPLVVTGNYCSANTSYEDHYNIFIVGTVWMDKDGDGLYDSGEGISGITITSSQGTYYAITGQSGGYAIPLTNGGSYDVTFEGIDVPAGTVRSVTVDGQSVLLGLLVEIKDTDQVMPWIPLLLE